MSGRWRLYETGQFFTVPVGIVVATVRGMATTHTSTASAPSTEILPHGGTVYSLFYRDNRAMTCIVSVEGEGSYVVDVTRLWDDESFSETFSRLDEAFQRHAEVASFLHESGWLLVERAVVPLAA